MISDLPIKVAQLKSSDTDAIKDMIRVYQEAYKNDKCFQLNLNHIIPDFTDQMVKTMTTRVKQPECEYFVAREVKSNKIVGWLALAFNFADDKKISEEHVLLLQYALLPDVVVKGKDRGIGTDGMKKLAHSLLKDFKEARQKQLSAAHCLLSTLVVDPEFQNKGVASALLSKAIHFTEIFSFPIWVQAPEACQGLFERHSFTGVGEYRLDLNEHVPKAVGKGKAKEVSSLGNYFFKFMVREEPLEPAIEAFKLSKVFAEDEEERLSKERLEKEKKAREQGILARISRVFSAAEADPESKEPLLGRAEQSASGEIPVAPSRAEASPSTPLLAESTPKGSQKSRPKGKAASTSQKIAVAPSRAEAGPSKPLLTESSSKGGQKSGLNKKAPGKSK